jgi:plastocyanin
MTFTLPESKAGMYTVACFETTGGQKHYEMGMQGTLTVSASSDY